MSSDPRENQAGLAALVAELRREIDALASRVDRLEQDSPRDDTGLRRELRSLRALTHRVEREAKRNRELSRREIRAIWNHPAIRRLARFNYLGLKLLGLFGLFGERPETAKAAPTPQAGLSSTAVSGLPGKAPAPESEMKEAEETYLRGFCALTNVRITPSGEESPPGRLIIDAARLFSEQLTGVGYYCEHLARALLRQYAGEITAYSGKPLPAWILDHGARPDFMHMPPSHAVREFEHLVKAPSLDSIVGSYDIYLHTSTSYAPLVRAEKMVAVIYDLAPIACPETVPEHVSQACAAYNRHLAETAEHFVAISEYTKQTFVELSGVDPARVDVIPVGMDPLFRRPVPDTDRARVSAKYGLSGPYILCTGTQQPRKNLLRLIQAYAQLSARRRNTPRLVLAGSEEWAAMPEFAQALEGLREDHRVTFTGYVDRGDLPALYDGCEIFAYPSYFEGYGMPVAEAMACGAPVLCGECTSLPEVAGDAAVYCDPLSVDAIADALEGALADTGRLAALREESFEQAETFPSWDDVAAQFKAVFEKVRAGRGK